MATANWWWTIIGALKKPMVTLAVTLTGGEGGGGAEVLNVDTGTVIGYVDKVGTTQFVVPKNITVKITPWAVAGWGTPAVQQLVMDSNKAVSLRYVPPNISITIALWEAEGSAIVTDVTTGTVLTTVSGQGAHPIQVPYTHVIRVEPQPVAGYDTPAAREFTPGDGDWYEFSYVDNSFVLILTVRGAVGGSVNVFNNTTGQAVGNYGIGEHTIPVTSTHVLTLTATPVEDYTSPAPQTITIGRADTVLTMSYTPNVTTPTPTLITTNLWGSWRLEEGTGTVANSEMGLPTALTLGADSGTPTTWIAGGGVYMGGGTQWLRRTGDTTMHPTNGITITLAVRMESLTKSSRLVNNINSNKGINVIATTTGLVQVAVGNGTSAPLQTVGNFTMNQLTFICLSVTQGGILNVNINGTEQPQKTFQAWVANNVNYAILLGYLHKGQVYYAAIHMRALNLSERANMVEYAKKVMTDRGGQLLT